MYVLVCQEAEFARRQREKIRNDKLEKFEEDRQGFVATLEAENESRPEAARQRRARLYKQWDRDVFQRIQQQVRHYFCSPHLLYAPELKLVFAATVVVHR